MRWTLALAGLGAAARSIHLPALAKLEDVTVVGASDPTRPTDLSFPVFATVDELLERTRPDMLVVAAPTPAHAELTRRGLEAHCHVLCEKPFMETLEEVDATIDLARRVGRRVVVNNEFRFMNCHAAAKEQIGTAAFGNLLFVTMHQTFFVTPETEAGWRGADLRRTAKDFGTHVLDLARFFFGEEPLSIAARMPRPENPAGPDYLNLIQLEFSGDRVAHITLDRLCRGRHRYLDVRLDGSRASIETSLGGRLEARAGIQTRGRRPFLRLDVAGGGRARLYHGESFRLLARDPLDLFAHATSRLVRAFLDALEIDVTPPCEAEDNRRTLALMLAAYDSAERRMPVDLLRETGCA
jgi:D-apiose dehydrogenase